MARAHELILGLVPWDDATQMRAHSVESIILKIGLIIRDDEIGGISAEALDEFARASEVRVDVSLLLDVGAEGVLCDDTSVAAAARLGHEEEGEGAEDAERHGRGGAEEQKVHGVTLGHVRDHLVGARGGHAHGIL